MLNKSYTAVGWQGISLRVPKDWSLVGVSGDEKKGYFRVDSPSASAIEVRWVESKTAPNLERRAKEFLKELERASKKRRVTFSSRVRSRKPTDAELKTGSSSVGFSWKGDRNGFGRILFCGECKRVIIAQVVSSIDDDQSNIAGEILNTLCDHGEPGWQTWALYDLQATLPSEFKLEKQTLMSSYISLAFKSKDGELSVERWGLANTLLKKNTLEEWFRKDSLPDYKGFRVQFEPVETEEDGHEVMKVTGKRAGIKEFAKTAVRSLTLRPLPSELVVYVWHCPESNRLFAVRVNKEGAAHLAREIWGRVICH